jgi:hypothetical protein
LLLTCALLSSLPPRAKHHAMVTGSAESAGLGIALPRAGPDLTSKLAGCDSRFERWRGPSVYQSSQKSL